MELCIIYFLLHTSLFPLHFLYIWHSHFPSSLCFYLLSLFLSFPSLCTFNFSVPSSLCLYSTCPFYLSFSLSYPYLQLFPLPLLFPSISLSIFPILMYLQLFCSLLPLPLLVFSLCLSLFPILTFNFSVPSSLCLYLSFLSVFLSFPSLPSPF